jgi:palmitoyl-protein thioesterase
MWWDNERWLRDFDFMPDLNNEREVNEEYRKNLLGVKNFGMFLWEDDHTVYPTETCWSFHFDEQKNLVKLRDQDSYKNDVLGLKTLDERGDLFFYKGAGDHMNLSDQIIADYFVPLMRD